MFVSSTSPGQEIKTPHFGEPFHNGHYNQSHDYTATLEAPDGISEEIENGSLVVEIEVDVNHGQPRAGKRL